MKHSAILPGGWEYAGMVSPNDSSAPLLGDSQHTYRIIDAGGHICAPGFPKVGEAGHLYRYPRIALPGSGEGVNKSPFSAEAKR